MSEAESNQGAGPRPVGAAALRQQRVDELVGRCRQEVLQQIIGPFGLTTLMFEDKDGGNMTTQHNAEKNIFANEHEKYNRKRDYGYKSARFGKTKEARRAKLMNRETFVDAYTGKTEPMKRLDKNGEVKTNAELDHTVPLKKAHLRGAWMKTPEQRRKLAKDKANLNFTTHKRNRAKGHKEAHSALSEANGYDQKRIKPLIEKAEAAVNAHMPTTGERLKYHAKEFALTGGKDAAKQGLRRALGVLLQELVNQAFLEVKRLIANRAAIKNFLDEIGQSLKAVALRVIAKWRDVMKALVSGGIEGLISNLLTFIINNFITTAAKVVTLIRESMKSLWRAIKMIVSPPAHMTVEQVTREVVKIVAGVVTLGIGMAIEESIKGFVMSVPLLVPMADVLAPALAGIVTGLATALVMFGIDTLFDAFTAQDTELLEAGVANGEAQELVVSRLAEVLDEQVVTSNLYTQAARDYERVMELVSASRHNLEKAVASAHQTTDARQNTIELFQDQFNLKLRLQNQLDEVLLLGAPTPAEGDA